MKPRIEMPETAYELCVECNGIGITPGTIYHGCAWCSGFGSIEKSQIFNSEDLPGHEDTQSLARS